MNALVILLFVAVAPAADTSSLPRAPGWTTARLLASPYATQAAAADERNVYVISSTTVARYDRATGRLLATATTPDTKHLNSGFLHDGKVWCAHSNYPAMPHESDIRVYEPVTGTLTVGHVFRDPPGSLVWCVRREGRWWCCFAHYGDDNARTVLVEYEPGGFDRERRRLSFPTKVIADWDEHTLLVSHHHFRVLYRLRLPEAGDTLEFVEALHCPFPGQGFAADPVTSGLIGIDRARRAVVFASESATAATSGGRR
jgi:hypothetical protein